MRMQELLIIMAILLLLFGATRLPALGSSLGSAIRNFKKGFGGDEAQDADDKSGGKRQTLSEGGSNPSPAEEKRQADEVRRS